jgi:hypothetical protein
MYVIDKAEESKANEVATSMSDERSRLNLVYRVERQRMRTMESARESGDKIISGGRFSDGGASTPWLSKCS